MVAAMGGLGASSHQSGSGDDTELMDPTNCCKMSKKNVSQLMQQYLMYVYLCRWMRLSIRSWRVCHICGCQGIGSVAPETHNLADGIFKVRL